MTRLEELTLKLADDGLNDAEASELEALLAAQPEAEAAHRRLLKVEAALRGQRETLDLAGPTLARLRSQLAVSVERGVMQQLAAGPPPDWARASQDRSRRRKEADHYPFSHLKSASLPRRLRSVWNRPAVLALAACAVLLLALNIWYFGPTVGSPVLSELKGNGASVERGGKSFIATAGTLLQPGDLLSTTTNRATLITYRRENTRIIISHDTSLKILSWKEGKRFELRRGRIETTVAHQTTGRPMIWRTPQAEATVRGTELALDVTANTTTLEVIEGKVELTSTDTRQSIQLTNSQYAIAEPGIELKAERFPGGRGTILREYWLDVDGNNVGELTRNAKYPNNPTGREYLKRFAGPTDWAINYGGRFHGYLYPPKTGLYTFWITAKESAQLRLSSDESTDHAELIASLHVSTQPDQWDKYPWQKSDAITLQAGRKYYIELLHKADKQRGDHCSVAWQPPGAKREVIPGKFLSPVPVKEKKAR